MIFRYPYAKQHDRTRNKRKYKLKEIKFQSRQKLLLYFFLFKANKICVWKNKNEKLDKNFQTSFKKTLKSFQVLLVNLIGWKLNQCIPIAKIKVFVKLFIYFELKFIWSWNVVNHRIKFKWNKNEDNIFMI